MIARLSVRRRFSGGTDESEESEEESETLEEGLEE
jgi:hypothetical protein